LLPILRNIIIGWEGLRTVYMMASHVDISVSSEVMAILSVAPTSKICANAWDALLWL
jgi:formyltetrahydrofolate synthetase